MNRLKENLVVFNSLSGKKEKFVPNHKENIGMYVCGPTVYNYVHLGNCRTFMTFDIVYRFLQYMGYKVRYVRNITDVGHLEDDADDTEDKIQKRAILEKKEPMEIAQHYTNDFREILNLFNNLPPNIEPQATGHLIEQIETIQKIIDNGFAYVSNGSVYFDVMKYQKEIKTYGELSGKEIDELKDLSRTLQGSFDKKNSNDFALWKKADEKHIMKWESPWSVGFPGWHIECTAMGHKYLGKNFDIHGGGMDLKFPHHECEIAQSKVTYLEKNKLINYWIHSNMLLLEGKKMSKSTGNTITPRELFSGENKFFDRAFSPMTVRFFMLTSHYRGELNITQKGLEDAEKNLHKIRTVINKIENLEPIENPEKGFTMEIDKWIGECEDYLCDDFNTPKLIAQFSELVKFVNKDTKYIYLNKSDKEKLHKFVKIIFADVLGINMEEKKENNQEKLNKVIELVLKLRKGVRDEKKWDLSDKIRDELLEIGIEIKDDKEKTNFVVK